ncbi:MAG: FAD:protein FMN transferase [Clostridiales bacterium]|nr:FAD:protein FMN transferase [Clostridiales bacterium]
MLNKIIIKKPTQLNSLLKNMKIRILCVCVILYATLPLTACHASQTPIVRTGLYFDTVIRITIYDAKKEACLDDCFELAKKYENLLSPTIENSDIWNINHSSGEPVEVSDETAALIKTAIYYCDITDGRIDITVEALNKLWNFHEAPALPSNDAISAALNHTDYKNIIIDGNIVTLTDSESAISLGFIAKGFIADKIKEYLISQGIDNAIIDLGGNILAIGSKPDGTPFNFGIQKPFDTQGTPIATLAVTDKSLVTSGVYERYFYQDDILYHHILNSVSGYPIQNNLLSVTILSDSSITGDALSTSCFVLGLDEGMKLIDSLDDTEAVFITNDYVLHYSEGLR